jgi:hypothetical protein
MLQEWEILATGFWFAICKHFTEPSHFEAVTCSSFVISKARSN